MFHFTLLFVLLVWLRVLFLYLWTEGVWGGGGRVLRFERMESLKGIARVDLADGLNGRRMGGVRRVSEFPYKTLYIFSHIHSIQLLKCASRYYFVILSRNPRITFAPKLKIAHKTK